MFHYIHVHVCLNHIEDKQSYTCTIILPYIKSYLFYMEYQLLIYDVQVVGL